MCAKFQGYLTPTTGFLAIDITFLTNIQGNHFSHNICAVFYHTGLKFSNLDPNWAKNRLLLLKTLDFSNCVDRAIVHWSSQHSINREKGYSNVLGLDGPSDENDDRQPTHFCWLTISSCTYRWKYWPALLFSHCLKLWCLLNQLAQLSGILIATAFWLNVSTSLIPSFCWSSKFNVS